VHHLLNELINLLYLVGIAAVGIATCTREEIMSCFQICSVNYNSPVSVSLGAWKVCCISCTYQGNVSVSGECSPCVDISGGD